MSKATTVSDEIERLRMFVIAARKSEDVAGDANKTVERLKQMYTQDQSQFTPEDIRFLNVLKGYLGVRLSSHKPSGKHTKAVKRKGDKLEHCWRCETPIDERFTENCPECSEKAYQWRICPVCNACGCQRSGRVLV